MIPSEDLRRWLGDHGAQDATAERLENVSKQLRELRLFSELRSDLDALSNRQRLLRRERKRRARAGRRENYPECARLCHRRLHCVSGGSTPFGGNGDDGYRVGAGVEFGVGTGGTSLKVEQRYLHYGNGADAFQSVAGLSFRF
jgi:hypothetical protein